MRSLIVDDELASRVKMGAILEEHGECMLADSGKAALDALKAALQAEQPFDLVTLDISMPEMSGLEVLKLIRHVEQRESLPAAKIVMVTAHAEAENVKASLKNGCDDFIVKPFNNDSIVAKLQKLQLLD